METGERERVTRGRRVDPRVRRAGWGTIRPYAPGLEACSLTATAVAECPRPTKDQSVSFSTPI